MFKRSKVVMLPTNKKSNLGYLNDLDIDYKRLSFIKTPFNGEGSHPQHLYILSDDDAKKGDWLMATKNTWANTITKCKNLPLADVWKKIIATTNESLGLPRPSEAFIEKFAKEYNKGNTITDVLVEYWTYTPGIDEDGYGFPVGHPITIPSVSTKDNTITIKKVKDSWTEDEVKELMKEAYLAGANRLYDISKNRKSFTFNGDVEFNQWIKQKL